MHNNAVNAEVVPITERHPQHRPPRSKATIWIGTVVLLLLLLFLVGFVPRHERNLRIAEEARQRQQDAPIVEVTRVRRSTVKSALTLPGTITAIVEAPIYARSAGYVSKRFSDIGDHVRAGQLLATIDAPDLDQQVDQARSTLQQSQSVLGQAQAQLGLATVTWKRDKALVEQGVLSVQEGDVQHATYDVAVANVRAAEQNVSANRANVERLMKLQSYERVVAPFDGIVTARNIDVGTLISATGAGQGNTSPVASTGTTQGGEMFRVAQSGRVRVFVSVPESSVASVRLGQQANVHVDALPTESFVGRVTRTANAIDPVSRTLLTEVQIDNRKGTLLPGMYATISFEGVRATPPLVIPSDSLITRGEGTMVAVVRDSVVHLARVRVGRDYGAQTEILDGLNENDPVILNPSDSARDNTRVSAREATVPANSGPSRNGGADSKTAGTSENKS